MQWKLKKSKFFLDIIYQNNDFVMFAGGEATAAPLVYKEDP